MTVVAMKPAKAGMGRRPADNARIIAALDVGSTKVCCLIGKRVVQRKNSPHAEKSLAIKVIGAGHQVTRGVRGGVIVDLDEAERSIRLAVDAAERMAGETINDIYVNVSCGRPGCQTWRGELATAGQQIGPHHVQRLVGAALSRVETGARVILHANPISYDLDDAHGVKDPVGMHGDNLSVDLNVVTAEPGPVRNLQMAVERCHLTVAGTAIAPYSAGLATLIDDEMALGVTLVDMGGATTSVSVFAEGSLVYADVVPVGGSHITGDLARGLSTTIAHAERLKTLYGSALPYVCDDREMVHVPLLGETGSDAVNKVPRSMLTGIIQPRVEETFELLRDRMAKQPATRRSGRRVVLTGGASQLTGVREVAGQILEKQVRLGFPRALAGLPDAARTPAFAGVNGLLRHALSPPAETMPLQSIARPNAANNNYLVRVGRWIRESF